MTTTTDLPAALRHSLPAWVWQLALPLVALVSGNIILSTTGADMAFQRLVYDHGAGWKLGDHAVARGLYHLGTLPAMLAVLVALGGLLLKVGRRLPSEKNFASLYLSLVLAVGPGLVTNVILKDHWGRPRPRDVVEFGGPHVYEPPLSRDPSSDGKSFPCGHATMGFFFFAHFFIHRRRNAPLAWTAIGGAVILGWTIGITRSVQGGHFLSDTWWAMGVMWFACAGLWHAATTLDNRQWTRRFFAWLQDNPRLGAVGIGTVVVLALLCALLATPYQRSQSVAAGPLPPGVPLRLSGTFHQGRLTVVSGEDARIDVEGSGHGMVWSKVLTGARQRQRGALHEVRFVQTRKGWFTELTQSLRLEIPLDRVTSGFLTLNQTRLELPILPTSPASHWKLAGDGDVTLIVPEGLGLEIIHEPGFAVIDHTSTFSKSPEGHYRQGRQPMAKVQLVLREGSVTLRSPASGEMR